LSKNAIGCISSTRNTSLRTLASTRSMPRMARRTYNWPSSGSRTYITARPPSSCTRAPRQLASVLPLCETVSTSEQLREQSWKSAMQSRASCA